MYKGFLFLLVVGLVFGSMVGCGPKKEGSSREAIDVAGTMQTVQEKTDYLISQAKAFYNSDDFQNAIDICQYILSTLDRDSQAAKDLLEKAKDALAAHAQKAVEGIKSNLPGGVSQ